MIGNRVVAAGDRHGGAVQSGRGVRGDVKGIDPFLGIGSGDRRAYQFAAARNTARGQGCECVRIRFVCFLEFCGVQRKRAIPIGRYPEIRQIYIVIAKPRYGALLCNL